MRGWTEDPFVRAFLDWTIELMGPSEWNRRRRAVEAFAIERGKPRQTEEAFDAGLRQSAIPPDRAAWYLYQCELYLRDPIQYEITQGSRIIPLIHGLGAV